MAKRLEYTISGDARDFQKALRTVDRGLAASEKQSHQFGKALSSSFLSVGKAAGLAGTAIGAGLVVEAKRSVEAFQESNKVAKQTQAVLKSTGGQANVTAKQVSNLATAISRKTGIDDEAIASGENLLLTFTNVHNEVGKGNDIFNRATRTIADMSVALGQDTKSSAIQLGKALNDPIKGITALSRVGVSFTAQQKDQIKTLVDSGKTLDAQKIILRELNKEFGGSAAAQATSTDKLRVAFGNLEEDLGSGLAPAVDDVANRLTKFAIDVEPKVIKAADRIAKTFGRKDLSLDQKFRLSYDQASKVFEPLVHEARQSVGKMRLGDKLGDAVDTAIPRILDAVAAAAPKAGERFVHGFMDAGPWGRLVGAGFLLAKMGGVGAFTRIGSQAGGGMATGMAASGGWKGIAGKIGGALGPQLAIAVALAFGPELVKKITDRTADIKIDGTKFKLPKSAWDPLAGVPVVGGITKAVDRLTGARSKITEFGDAAEKAMAKFNKTGNVRGLDQMADRARALAGEFPKYETNLNRFADGADRAFDKAARSVAANSNRIARSLSLNVSDPLKKTSADVLSTTRDVSNHFGYMERTSKGHLKDIKGAVRDNMGVIKTRLGTDSEGGKNALAANFRLAAKEVKKSMDSGAISTRTGTRQIRGYLVKALEALGLTGEQAQNKIDHGTTGQPGNLNKGIPRLPAARGMYIGSPGERGGDTVPLQAMVGRGEYAAVFNGQQQSVLNKVLGATLGTSLDGFFNRFDRPHYQGPGLASGGTIPRVTVAGRGAPGALAQRAVNIDRSAALELLAQAMAANGGGGESSTTGLVAQVRRALAWAHGHGWSGQVTSGFRSRAQQQFLWDHRASNPNPVAPPGTSNHERGRAVDVSDIAGFQHAMATAPANARLRWYGPKDPVHFSVDGHARGGRLVRLAGGGSYSHAQLAALWKRAGGDSSRADLMAAIAQAESSGNPTAHNASGASGLWQILGEPFAGDVYDPLTNARMAVAKYRSQGLGAWEVYTKGTYRQFLTAGADSPSGGGAAAARRAFERSHSRAVARRRADTNASRRRALHAPMGGRKIGGGSRPDTSAHGVAGAGPGDRQFLPTTMSDPAGDMWGGMPSWTDQTEAANQPLIDAINANTEAQQAAAQIEQDQVAAIKSLRDAQAADTELRARIFGTQTGQVLAGIADMVSGQIGGRVGLGIQTPGFAGGGVRY